MDKISYELSVLRRSGKGSCMTIKQKKEDRSAVDATDEDQLSVHVR